MRLMNSQLHWFPVYVRRFRDVRSVEERRYGVVVDFGTVATGSTQGLCLAAFGLA